ncbi:unnamed protein product [Ambrosiozyma monospora]|uniref:Unnamed protein product n=1 Tax=Ambrosiozyma monospora TaxID=43982 RepID=A0ACB5SXF6_AMBMO|nr:unnamed protein product [Ambrosiozyma monospora]
MKVLSESVISSLLRDLSLPELKAYQTTLVNSLLEFKQDHSIIPPRIVTQTPVGATHLFMASTGETVGMKALTGSKAGFKGVTAIVDKYDGYPIGILNAATLTAFRTALCSTLGLVKTFPPESTTESLGDLICFGVGDQGLWHVRLALALYSGKFENVFIVNRSLDKAEKIIKDDFSVEFPNVKFQALAGEDSASIKKSFVNVSVAFTCVPSTKPTIVKSYIDSNVRDKVYIGAIGSYKPHMIEVDGDLTKEYILKNGGKVIVDSVEHCMDEAGEFLQTAS